MTKTFELNERERVLIFLALLAREREINISIVDARKYGLAHLDKLELELQECLDLQKRIG
jgi:hypothetical protein